MNIDDIIKRIDELIEEGGRVLKTGKTDVDLPFVDNGAMKGFRAGSLSFIEKIYGLNHTYFSEFDKNTIRTKPLDAERGLGILKAIRTEIAGGGLFTFKGLVTVEIFSDFLDMSRYLLSEGYKDPAAVMGGSVLEEHLRQLCLKHGIEKVEVIEDRNVPKKADKLNSDLAKAEIYNKLDQKQVTAWLDLRNKAAHGKYNEYDKEQVRLLLDGITGFMIRVSV